VLLQEVEEERQLGDRTACPQGLEERLEVLVERLVLAVDAGVAGGEGCVPGALVALPAPARRRRQPSTTRSA
jgi:hypothetical protein